MLAIFLLCSLCYLSASVQAGVKDLKIGAFNIQVFGQSKLKKADVVETLIKVISRYDVVLIQEVRDSSETVIFDFVNLVNKSPESSSEFELKVSDRLGRTDSKEQYAFLYRKEKVQVLQDYQYADPQDLFEREPYSVLLAPVKGGTVFPRFFLVGIHIKPSDTTRELNALVDVYDELVDEFGTSNAVILGDMNAECGYLSQKRYKALDLVTDDRFTWLIDSTVDTTTSTSECSYDRIIAAGDALEFIVEGSAGIFRFDEDYGLDQKQTKRVSDHYPVEFTVEGKVSANQPLKICSFNAQVFGKTKAGKSTVVYTLSKIVQQCDIILIQEIRDSSEIIIHKFLETVNRDCFAEGIEYSLSVSERLGRTSYKEQYAFFYRTDKVKVLKEHQYSDPSDKFQREPFAVLFGSIENDFPPFFLVGIRTHPSDTFDEMNALVGVYNELIDVFGTTSGVILGDMNADCGYLSQKKYELLELVTDSRFSSLIDSTVDTTSSHSHCCYDRIFVAGAIRCFVVAESAGVIKFDEQYSLSANEAKAVSNHYPVMFHVQRGTDQQLSGDREGYCKL